MPSRYARYTAGRPRPHTAFTTDACFHATDVDRDCFRSPYARLCPAKRPYSIAGAGSRDGSITWNLACVGDTDERDVSGRDDQSGFLRSVIRANICVATREPWMCPVRPHLIKRNANRLLRQCCAPLRPSRSGNASWPLTVLNSSQPNASRNDSHQGVSVPWHCHADSHSAGTITCRPVRINQWPAFRTDVDTTDAWIHAPPIRKLTAAMRFWNSLPSFPTTRISSRSQRRSRTPHYVRDPMSRSLASSRTIQTTLSVRSQTPLQRPGHLMMRQCWPTSRLAPRRDRKSPVKYTPRGGRLKLACTPIVAEHRERAPAAMQPH